MRNESSSFSVAIRPNKEQNIADEEFWYAIIISGTIQDTGKVPALWFTSSRYLEALVGDYDVIINKDLCVVLLALRVYAWS